MQIVSAGIGGAALLILLAVIKELGVADLPDAWKGALVLIVIIAIVALGLTSKSW